MVNNLFRDGLRSVWTADSKEKSDGRKYTIGASDIGGCPTRVALIKSFPETHGANMPKPDTQAMARMLAGTHLEEMIKKCILAGYESAGWEYSQEFNGHVVNSSNVRNVVQPDLVIRTSGGAAFANIEIKTMGSSTYKKLEKAVGAGDRWEALLSLHPKYAYQVLNQCMVLSGHLPEGTELDGWVLCVNRDTLDSLAVWVPMDRVKDLVDDINTRLRFISKHMEYPDESKFLPTLGIEEDLIKRPDYFECQSCPLRGKSCEAYKYAKQVPAEPIPEKEIPPASDDEFGAVSDQGLISMYFLLKNTADDFGAKSEKVKDEVRRRLKEYGTNLIQCPDGSFAKTSTIVGTRVDTSAMKSEMPELVGKYTVSTESVRLEIKRG